jgi:hypothetical protein
MKSASIPGWPPNRASRCLSRVAKRWGKGSNAADALCCRRLHRPIHAEVFRNDDLSDRGKKNLSDSGKKIFLARMGF